MAMLAGPRRRKLYNLTPRGKALYEDENNVGTKLLEKMGWTKGNGLGRNEHGATDFVRVNYKNDALGIGYTARDDQWTEHENKFNGLLQSLQGDENNMQNTDVEASTTVGFGFQNEVKKIKGKLREKVSGESLEEKSKNSKVRVHYKKFTKGKDIAQYSEKDLANIFGKKVEEETMNAISDGYQLPDNYCIAKEGEECEIQTKFAGVLTIKAGSSVDYFKQKMNAIKKKMRGTFDHEETRLVDEDPEICEKNETLGFSSPKTKKSKLKKEKRLKRESVDVGEAHKPLKSIDENNKTQLTGGEYSVEVEATQFCEDVEERSTENVEAEKSTKQLKICNKDENVTSGEPIESRYTIQNDRLEGNDAKINEFGKKSQSFLQSIKKKKNKTKKSNEAEAIEAEEEQRLVVENPVLQLVEEEKPELSSKLAVEEKTKKKKQKRSNGEAEESSKKICKKRKKEDDVFLIQGSFENVDAPKKTQSIETTDNDNIKVQKKKSKKSQKKRKAELLESANKSKIIESETNSLINNGSSCQTIASDQVTNDMFLAPAVRDAIIKNESSRILNDASETTDQSIISENEDAPKENCSLEDLIAKRESYNIYTISSFSAEKFSYADLDCYVGSNLQQIVGYGLSDELKLDVKVAKRDEERINHLWNCSINKYKDANPKQIYKKYIKEAYTARRTKKKIPRLHVKSLKRKHVFTGF